MIGGLPQRRGPRRVIGDREPASVFRRWFWLVGACGWKVRPGAPVQGPGQAFCPLRSLPALGFPGFSELGLTVPGSQPHAATDPNWTVDRADRGPLHRASCSSTCVVLAMVESSPQRSTLRQGLCCCLGQASMAVRRLFGRRCCGPAGGSRPGGWTERWVTDRVAGSRIRPMMAGPPTWPLGAGGAGSKGSHVGCQPDRGVGGSSRSRPPERWSSACWRACRVV
jgi:hypothetical protein